MTDTEKLKWGPVIREEGDRRWLGRNDEELKRIEWNVPYVVEIS